MYDAGILVVALLVTFVPGLAAAAALGVRRPALLLAVAPGASVALAGGVAVACALMGLRFGPLPVLVAAGVLVLLAVPGVVRGRSRRAVSAVVPARRRSAAHVAAAVAGVVMTVVGIGYASWSWLVGLGGLATPPQEHDMIIHAVQAAYIARTGRAAPWELVPADVLTGGPVAFYPSGFHLLAALTADLTGDIVGALNATTVVFLAVVSCVGVAVLGWVAARQLGLSSSSAMLAGGVASLVMAGMYRPAFQLMHDGGILANAASLSIVPGVTAAVLLLPRLRWGAAVVVGVAAAGTVWVHPNAAVSVGVTVLAWWAGQAVSPWGRHRLRGLVRPALIAGAAAAVLLVPAVAPGLGAAGRTGGFPADTGPVSFRDALGSTFGFPIAGWLDQGQGRSQVWVVVLLFLGVFTVLALRRGIGPVAAWLTWSIVIMGAWLSPAVGFESVITGFFYNAMLRTWSHVSLLAPVLVGLGIVLTGNRVAVLVRRRTPLRARWSAAVLAVAAFACYAAGPAVGYAEIGRTAVATRYSDPDFVRIGADDERAIAWLADRVRPGERVFNSPNDGSTYLYVERGVPIVNVYTLGLPGVPYSYRLLEDFDQYPENEAIRQQLVDLNVRWVYVDQSAPGIGSAGSPEGWAGDGGFSLAPGLQNLDGLPGMESVFRSGTVSVYSLDLDRMRRQAP